MTAAQALALADELKALDRFDAALQLVALYGRAKREGMQQMSKALRETI